MSFTKIVKVTLNKKAVINQYSDMLIKADYFETDTFEDGLEYGPLVIRIEPPIGRWFYTFSNGVRLKYLGSNEWELEENINNLDGIKEALRLITPVISKIN